MNLIGFPFGPPGGGDTPNGGGGNSGMGGFPG